MDVYNRFNHSKFSQSKCDSYGLRCQLCKVKRIRFYCQNCVKNGDFTESYNIHCPERFAEKNMKLIMANRVKQSYGLENKLKHIHEVDVIKQNIELTKERIKLLKCMIDEKREQCQKADRKVEKMKQRVKRITKRSLVTKCNVNHKVNKLQQSVEKFDKRASLLENIHSELSFEMTNEVQSLIKYIFQVEEGQKPEDFNDELSCTISQLDEAARTSYIRGTWVQIRSEEAFRIVQSELPASGDYNMYYNWLSTYGTVSASSEFGFNNCLHGISSALTYTAQALSVLSFIFNIRLPHKCNYHEFSLEGMTAPKLVYKVAKINANVMYLCLAQGMDNDAVHPRKTLLNLSVLFNEKYCRFRKTRDLCQDSSMVDIIEDQLVCELNSIETDDESDDERCLMPDESLDISPDWEAVPRSIPSEDLNTLGERATVDPGFTGSIVSSAAASVVSFWRGYTGGQK